MKDQSLKDRQSHWKNYISGSLAFVFYLYVETRVFRVQVPCHLGKGLCFPALSELLPVIGQKGH